MHRLKFFVNDSVKSNRAGLDIGDPVNTMHCGLEKKKGKHFFIFKV